MQRGPSSYARGALSADFALMLADGSTIEASYRSVAHFLPGRHLSLLEPRRNGDRTPA